MDARRPWGCLGVSGVRGEPWCEAVHYRPALRGHPLGPQHGRQSGPCHTGLLQAECVTKFRVRF